VYAVPQRPVEEDQPERSGGEGGDGVGSCGSGGVRMGGDPSTGGGGVGELLA